MVPTNSNTTRCHDNRFYRNLILALVTIFVLLMAVISIAWLFMHPHDPGFEVTSLSVTHFNVSESHVQGRYKIGLTITNPNKIKTQVVLHRLICLKLYGQKWRSVAAVQQRVSLEKLTNKSVKVDFELRKEPLKVAPQVLVKDLNKGVVHLNVVLSAKVRFQAGIWPSMDKILDVKCGDLDVEFHSQTKDTGRLLSIGKNCDTQNTGGT
ncbi:unnamed protein product [Sphenostylis stenocarpa]|uniref:Late embryogenesis abundant protein LEA-2 subgroup domain-containing protein n=1 Tax=Sphenostylis stenocarpa TaxID=92480 RepID=A0AA86W6Q1_9FABA|nr:unnamed protein product [Sphenostylis stenocarpa]